MIENQIALGILVEVWQKEEDEEFDNAIETILERKGLKYISTLATIQTKEVEELQS